MRNLYFGISIAPYRMDLCNWLYRNYSCDIYHRAQSSGDLAFNLAQVESECGFPLLYYPSRGRNRSRLKTIADIIRRNDPEVVFVFEFSLLTLQVLLIRFFRKKKFRVVSFCDDSIHMIQQNDFSPFHRVARIFVPPFLDNLILCNRQTRDWYFHRFGKGVYFPIIADENRWRKELEAALPRAESFARQYRLGEVPIVLFVGRLIPLKNLPTLLKAFKPMVGRAQLVLIGEGESEKDIRQLDRDLGTEALFLGKLTGMDLHAWFNLADIIVLPSTIEAFGAVVNEALMSGLYALVSSQAGSVTLIEPGVNGDVFEPTSVQELTGLLDRYICFSEGKTGHISLKPSRMTCLFEESIVQALEELERQ